MRSSVPQQRIRVAGTSDVNPLSEFVLYWMVAFRRVQWNFALQRAIDWARELKKPLIAFEPLRCDYRWASDRLHHFVIQGMADNARRLARKAALYYPFVEPERGAGKGLLSALAARAAVVVSDDYPCFFLPRMAAAAATQIPVRFELVDSNGLLPLRAATKIFARAVDMRRFIQQNLREHLDEFPEPDIFSGRRLELLAGLPREIGRRWPVANVERLAESPSKLGSLPLDHGVRPVETEGGSRAAQRVLRDFLDHRLQRYGAERNQPAEEVTSGLSPYLHFGHISAHQVFIEVMARENWTPKNLSKKATGSSTGWWGVSESAESFFDELITWRELGYNMCSRRDDYDRYESLPGWARQTLADHAADPREHVYSLDEFETAATHDELWNAAQRQLLREGRIHNYLRMLWGKKIVEWSRTPREAVEIMIELNNKYALDGRDPNSYSGIFWCLGRYDRPWGPERPIFGKVRYMSSENTARKLRVETYLREYSARSDG